MKKWLLIIGTTVVMGVGLDLLFSNAHVALFPAEYTYKKQDTFSSGDVFNCCDYDNAFCGTSETKMVPLMYVRNFNPSRETCIENLSLTGTGYLVYGLVVWVLPFVLLYFVFNRKK